MKSKEKIFGFNLKVAGACNLNCSYCYVYNMGDTSFRDRPRTMDRCTQFQAIERIREYAEEYDTKYVFLEIHGGEPLLLKKRTMAELFRYAHARLAHLGLDIGIQTNGVLLDRGWLEIFEEYSVGVGVSIDGPKVVHDLHRVDHKGRGSFDRVASAIKLLAENSDRLSSWGVLAVSNPDYQSVETFELLRSLGASKMDFLWPDYHHDLKPPFSSQEIAHFYISLFDHWYGIGDSSIRIRLFEAIIRGLFGYSSGMEGVGGNAITGVTIETDGSIQALDLMRICGDRYNESGLNIFEHKIEQITSNSVYQICVQNQSFLPKCCRECSALHVCGGGYLPHRFSKTNGFANPSVHCEALLSLISHIFQRIRSDLHPQSETLLIHQAV